MAKVEWLLNEVLEKHGLTAYKLEQAIVQRGHPWGKNTIYRFTRGDGPQLIDRDTLGLLIDVLSELAGKPVLITDLMRPAQAAAEDRPAE